jgi:hypothetical protein
MDMRPLTAGVAIIADELSAAVQAVLLMRAPVGSARLGFDRPAEHRTGGSVPDRL